MASHSSYIQTMEYSDKIILPLSVSLELRIINLPLPPLLILIPDRNMHDSVYCSVLEFTAEEDYIYIPSWMFPVLGYKVINTSRSSKKDYKTGYGLTLYSMPVKENNQSYIIPKCTSISIVNDHMLSAGEILREFQNYSIIAEDRLIPILILNKRISIIIKKVLPEPICMISEQFEIEFCDKTVEREELAEPASGFEQKNRLLGLEVLPEWPEKYPKFLLDIMRRNTPRKLQIKTNERSRTHHIPLIFLDDTGNQSIRTSKRIKYTSKVRKESKKQLPILKYMPRLENTSTTPKVLMFNLPSITLNKKKTERLFVRPSGAMKWLKQKKQRAESSEVMPFEIIAQYRQNKELN